MRSPPPRSSRSATRSGERDESLTERAARPVGPDRRQRPPQPAPGGPDGSRDWSRRPPVHVPRGARPSRGACMSDERQPADRPQTAEDAEMEIRGRVTALEFRVAAATLLALLAELGVIALAVLYFA